MKRLKCSMIILSLLVTGSGCTPKPVGVTDATRIVVTSAEIADILDALDIDEVVGITTTNSNQLPARYQDIASVGESTALDIDIIQSLKPTLVLGTHTDEVSKLQFL